MQIEKNAMLCFCLPVDNTELMKKMTNILTEDNYFSTASSYSVRFLYPYFYFLCLVLWEKNHLDFHIFRD